MALCSSSPVGTPPDEDGSADLQHVLAARVSLHDLYAGVGYGGSCFPKDVNALVFDGRNLYEPSMVAAFGLEYHCIGRAAATPLP